MKNFFQLHKIPLLLVFSSLLFYVSFGYDLQRTDLVKLFGLYFGLFFLTWKLLILEKRNFWFLAGAALLFRLCFLGALPNLSLDFYRFIWDGRILAEGLNPYLSVPANFVENSSGPVDQATSLIKGMGTLSPFNHTSYPPLNQLIFAMAALLTGKSILGSVIVMRIVIIVADLGILYFGKKLLEDLKLPFHRIFWFILNPFVIIELTGNLHFEGVMLFFLIWSIFLLKNNKWILSAVIFGLSVLLKLLPLIFLPLLFWYFIRRNPEKGRISGIGNLAFYYLIVGLVVVAGFLPFLSSGAITNFGSSISLWFQKFEFNGSFYYVIREIGYWMKGYNVIGTVGKILPVFVVLFILGISFYRKNRSIAELLTAFLFAVSFYLFLSTTVHPWYLATPLLLCIFTRFRFPLVWTLVVVLSYAAYADPEFKENLWLVALEYSIVFGVLVMEVFFPKKITFGLNI